MPVWPVLVSCCLLPACMDCTDRCWEGEDPTIHHRHAHRHKKNQNSRLQHIEGHRNFAKHGVQCNTYVKYPAVSMASYIHVPLRSSLLCLLLPLPAICHPCCPAPAGWRLAPFSDFATMLAPASVHGPQPPGATITTAE